MPENIIHCPFNHGVDREPCETKCFRLQSFRAGVVWGITLYSHYDTERKEMVCGGGNRSLDKVKAEVLAGSCDDTFFETHKEVI